MSIAKVTEVIASSTVSFDDAIEQGIKRACKTIKNVKSAWVANQQVSVESKDGTIKEYRVTLKLTFVLND